MKSITVSRDTAPIRQLKPHSPITPVCVPIELTNGFSEEISGHFSNRVYSLWERLGLVFLEEGNAEPQQTESHVVVNNFTQQIIFQLFSQKNISRLINLNQPGFVLIDKARVAAQSAELAEKKRIIEQLEKRKAAKKVYAVELESVFRLLTDDRQERDVRISDETLSLVLLYAVRKIRNMGSLSGRNTTVLRKLVSKLEKHERFKKISRSLNRLLDTESLNDTERFGNIIRTILFRLSDIEVSLAQAQVLDPTVKRVINKAVEKAMDIALSEEEQQPSAEQVAARAAELFGEDFPIQRYFGSRSHAVGTAADNRPVLASAGADIYNLAGSVSVSAASSLQNSYENYYLEAQDTAAENAPHTAKSAAELLDADLTVHESFEGRNDVNGVSAEEQTVSAGIDAFEAAGSDSESTQPAQENSYLDYYIGVTDTALHTARGAVLPGSGEYFSDSAVFLLEKAEEQLSGQRSDVPGIVSLRETELVSLISELIKEHFDRLSELNGGSAEKVTREIIEAVRYMQTYVMHTEDVLHRVGAITSYTVSRPSHKSSMQERPMVASLFNRVSGYIADKLSYENGDGVSQLSVLNGGDSYKEYRILAQAERYVPDNISSLTLNRSNFEINNSSGVYLAQYNYNSSAEMFFDESYEEGGNYSTTANNVVTTQTFTMLSSSGSSVNESYLGGAEISYKEGESSESSNTAITNNISGDVQNITQLRGSVSPINKTYSTNNTEISCNEGDNSNTNTTITNNIGGDTQDTSQLSGSVSPINNAYSDNAEITYNEAGGSESSNTAITNNISGDTQNITQLSGSVSPANNAYSDNTEITYNEGDSSDTDTAFTSNIGGDTQNFTQLSGSVSPMNNSLATDVSIIYIENNETVDMTQPTEPSSQSSRKTPGEQLRTRAVGHAQPFRGSKRSRSERRTRKEYAAISEPGAAYGTVLPESYIREIAYIGSRFIRDSSETVKTENVPFAQQAVRSDISYLKNSEIFRPTQRDGSVNEGKKSSYRDRLDSKTLEALDRMISQAQENKGAVGAAGSPGMAGAAVTAGLTDTSSPAAMSAEKVSEREFYGSVAPAVEAGQGYSYMNTVQFDYRESESEHSVTLYGSLVTDSSIPKSVGSTEMNIIFRSLKNAAKLKSSIQPIKPEVKHLARIISALEKEAGTEKNSMTALKSSFSFRTLDDAEEMVMLVPPAQTDSGMAESSYMRSLPPIEHKQREEQTAPRSTPSKPKVINNTQTSVQTVKNAVSGGFENMTREEINKLTDMVYSQLHTRIMRERRRIGM